MYTLPDKDNSKEPIRDPIVVLLPKILDLAAAFSEEGVISLPNKGAEYTIKTTAPLPYSLIYPLLAKELEILR